MFSNVPQRRRLPFPRRTALTHILGILLLLDTFAYSLGASPLVDTPYEEIVPTVLAYAGQPALGGGSLPFPDRVLQAVPAPGGSHGGGALVRTSADELWMCDATGQTWSQLSASKLRLGAGPVILTSTATTTAVAIAHSGGVSLLQCTGPSTSCVVKAQRVAALSEPKCAAAITGGSYDAGSNELVVGCAAGLYTGMASAAHPAPLASTAAVGGAPVLWSGAWSGYVGASTLDRMFVRSPSGAWWWEWASDDGTAGGANGPSDCGDASGGSVEFPVTVGAFDAAYGDGGGLWIGSSRGLQAWDLASGALRRYGRVDGVPETNVTALLVPSLDDAPCGLATAAGRGSVEEGAPAVSCLWVGTAHGLARRLGPAASAGAYPPAPDDGVDKWRYYRGRRYVLSDGVSALASLGGGRLLVASAQGVTVLEGQRYTLKKKAEKFQAMVEPRHDRHGYVGDCSMAQPGVVSTCALQDSDNDGLWTAMYAASQAFKYSVCSAAGDKAGALAALTDARKRIAADSFLYESSGGLAYGFAARSASLVNESIHSGGTWHNSTRKPGWKWKGDTSSDEVTGHMFSYPIYVHALSGGLDKQEAAAVVSLARGLVDHLLDHNLTLADPATGQPTTWGKWSPHWLNEVRAWSDNRGLRALELLSYLAAAEELTGDAKYGAAANHLRDDLGYGRMMVNAKITDPCDDNHSDDEEAFLPLYTYAAAFKRMNRPLDAPFLAVMRRFCRETHREGSSFYLTVCQTALGGKPDPRILDDLRGWPLDLIEWTTKNSDRADVWAQPAPFSEQSTRAVPSSNAVRTRWNANPYEMDTGNGGRVEGDPGSFLLPYWMARYHGLLVEGGG